MKVLYFIAGPADKQQKQLAKETGALIRDSLAWHSGDYIEQCDAVLGEAPKPYQQFGFHEKQPEALALLGGEVAEPSLHELILNALSQLDQANDAHWTHAGLPNVKAVESILGLDITRADISAAAPEFRREV
ncbi:hypothetical protein H0A36_24135 [Endozoicomonas sp. SM1973]|uniref:Uncharacterized protein n=1 Tax=Spartinivicinus marinus TaxID=2994442 RepID=A0A853IGH5_9GAMM|nr:hypothetical protein [Spartinivicinus marinus]NYZ69114.1 hypothetical protein [Spartinivicinus marinus]